MYRLRNSHIRTLYITGFPEGTTNEELNALFDEDDWGYVGAVIKKIINGSHTKLVAYATFTTHVDARRAKEELDGCIMDWSCRNRLRVEWARQNSRVHPHLYDRYVLQND